MEGHGKKDNEIFVEIDGGERREKKWSGSRKGKRMSNRSMELKKAKEIRELE